MINPLELLRREHDAIEQFLIELETIIESRPINFSNLFNVLTNFSNFWDEHEEKEEKIFGILEEDGFKIPTKKITFEHKTLRKQRDEISKALSSRSEIRVREWLNNSGKEIINLFRKHMGDEDWILYSISLDVLNESTLRKLQIVGG